MLKSLALLLAGAAAAATLIVSCSDDAADDADAAACDCPAAEPPLTGRIVRVEGRETNTAMVITAFATCPASSTLLGGGCYTEGGERLTPQLVMSGEPNGGTTVYQCRWRNPTAVEVTTVAYAVCLTPAQ